MNISPGNVVSPRTRIMDAFEQWWRELEAVQFADFDRATVCLQHISRLFEDAVYVEDFGGVLDEENRHFETVLAQLVVDEYSEIAYNCFRNMIAITNIGFLNSCARMISIFKLCCRDIQEAFYEIFPLDELEDFLKERLVHTNELFQARISFLFGEILIDNEIDVNILEILAPKVAQLKRIRAKMQGRDEEILQWMRIIEERSAYATSVSVRIPLPDEPSDNESFWVSDESENPESILSLITVLNSSLHLIAALAEFSDAVAVIISEELVKECIEICRFPSFAIQTYALACLSSMLVHRKMAMEFVEFEGHIELYKLMQSYHELEDNAANMAPQITYIFVALSKHSPALDLLVKPTNAPHIVDFILSLVQKKGTNPLETNQNILEWIGEAIHHPLLLRELHRRNILGWLQNVYADVFRMQTQQAAEPSQLVEYTRTATMVCLKYIVANLFWGYQYSKSLFTEVDELKPLNKAFTTQMLIRKNYIGSNGAIDIVDALLSNPAVIKVDDQEVFLLEAFVFKNLIRSGHLPKGLTIDLFGGDSYQTSNIGFGQVHADDETHSRGLDASFAAVANEGGLSAASAGASSSHGLSNQDIDNDLQSVVSMVTRVMPEWTIVAACLRTKIIPSLMRIIMQNLKDSVTVCLALFCLQLLCVDAAAIVEIMQYDFGKHIDAATVAAHQEELAIFQNKKGLEILLTIVGSQDRRDPSITVASLKLLAAMSAAPYFRYNGPDVTVAMAFFEDYLKSPYYSSSQQLATEKKKQLFDTAKKHIMQKLAYNALENVQRSVRKSIRANAGISSLMQLLHYKKNLTYAVPIRLETVKVLLGLQQDDDIKQILFKLRIPAMLDNQIQVEKSQLNMFETNSSVPSKFQEKNLLQYQTENLVNLLRGFPMLGVQGTAMDAALGSLEDAQEHMLRKNIVDHSNVRLLYPLFNAE